VLVNPHPTQERLRPYLEQEIFIMLQQWRSTPTILGGCILAISAFIALTAGTTSADDGDKLRRLIKDQHAAGADFWIYNDIGKAMQAARKLNKPIFVTFRCVPCKACSGFDAEVAGVSDVISKLARDKFIPVRQIEMKGVDLSLFQFDHDLNWAAMFVNADGVVYARYGTQSAKGPDAFNSIKGLETTMRRVLELHAGYPANKDALIGKRAKQKSYKTALQMPGFENRDKFRAATSKQNCIHCHNIHDAEQVHAQQTGRFTQDMLWRYPLPDNVGLVIDPNSGIRVRSVTDGTPAAKVGLRRGEDIIRMNGQPMTSIADMQWVLHNLPNTDVSLKVEGSQSGTHVVRLKKGWKKSDISWRGSIWSLQPKLRVWAPALDARQRKANKIPDGQSALVVRWINVKSPGGRSARDSGLRQGDIVIALAGKKFNMTPSQFNVHIKLNYKVGDVLPLTVLRSGRKREIRIKLVE
jgi:hypothetical protein